MHNVTSSVPSICLEALSVITLPKRSNVLFTFPIYTRGMFSRASACERSPKLVLQVQGNLASTCQHPLC